MTGGITFERKITLGNIASIVGTLMAIAGIWWNFSGEFATAKSNIDVLHSQVAIQAAVLPNVQDRLTIVEINQKNGADRGQQFQSDTKAALGKIQDQQLAILQQLAALAATRDERLSHP